jgi:guanylate kinase
MRRELAAVHLFDYVVVNDELERCVGEVCSVVEAERAGDVAAARARFGRAAQLARLRDRFDF